MPLAAAPQMPTLPLLPQRPAAAVRMDVFEGARSRRGCRKPQLHTARPPPPVAQERAAAAMMPAASGSAPPSYRPVPRSPAPPGSASSARRHSGGQGALLPLVPMSPAQPTPSQTAATSAPGASAQAVRGPPPAASPVAASPVAASPTANHAAALLLSRTPRPAETVPGFEFTSTAVSVGESLLSDARALGRREEAAVLRVLDDRQVMARERFMQLLRQCEWELRNFSSATVLCDVLMTQAANATQGEQSPSALRISVACYVFDRLCEALGPTYAHTMRWVRNEVFSGVFANAGGIAPDGTPGASQWMGRAQVPAAMVQHGLTAEAAAAHRYIGCPMYFEHAIRFQTQLGRSARVCDGLASSFAQHQLVLDRACASWQRVLLSRVFGAWRTWHKRNVVESWIKHRRRGRVQADLETRIKECVVVRWRLLVDRGKVRRMTEREDSLMAQLGNAKNQFTLQCFKTERYLITIEELRKQLAEVTRQLADEKRRNVDVCARMDGEQDRVEAEVHGSLNKVVRTMEDWIRYADSLVSDSVKGHLADHRGDINLLTEELVAHTDDKQGKGAEGTERSERRRKDILEGVQFRPAERLVLRWANQMLRKSGMLPASRKGPTNFTTDWQDCEYLIILMNQVAPRQASLSLIQRGNIMHRAEGVVDTLPRLQISYIPAPEELVQGRSSSIFLVLSGLFRCYATRQFALPIAAEQEAAQAAAAAAAESGGDKQQGSKEGSKEEEPKSPVKAPWELSTGLSVEDCIVELTERLREMKDRHNQTKSVETRWAQLAAEVEEEATDIMRARARKQDAELQDPRELAKYVRLQRSRFKDIGNGHTQAAQQAAAPSITPVTFDVMLDNVQRLLRENFGQLRRIFTHYAHMAGSKTTMGVAEYWKFCGDIFAFDADRLSRSQMLKIFTKANAEAPGIMTESSDESAADDDNPESELIPSEFVECLIRIADCRVQSEVTLHQRFEVFLTDFVLPNAAKPIVHQQLRDQLYDPEVQTVIRKYTMELQKVFRAYCAIDKKSGNKRGRTLRTTEFSQLLRDANLMAGALDDRAVQVIFGSLQSYPPERRPVLDDRDDTDAAERLPRSPYRRPVANDEVVFHEFTEVFMPAALFRFPSPYNTVANRMEHLVSAHLLPALRARQKALKLDQDVPAVDLLCTVPYLPPEGAVPAQSEAESTPPPAVQNLSPKKSMRLGRNESHRKLARSESRRSRSSIHTD
eukprot:TRINITY_DN22905_c0_g1_i1.p1 TRINITY_DN22905_c0_g1~~TRINITY_DN22905_c0_g1_i1.p1  ORF type:complete len:1216 (+),score=299.56 TRINITY_DN22905_c0_g1_i1:96-3743(+)